MTYYVFEIMSKVIRKKTHSKAVALFTLDLLNKKRGELWVGMMDKATYEKNYGIGNSC